jgi:hypothetical protein
MAYAQAAAAAAGEVFVALDGPVMATSSLHVMAATAAAQSSAWAGGGGVVDRPEGGILGTCVVVQVHRATKAFTCGYCQWIPLPTHPPTPTPTPTPSLPRVRGDGVRDTFLSFDRHPLHAESRGCIQPPLTNHVRALVQIVLVYALCVVMCLVPFPYCSTALH